MTALLAEKWLGLTGYDWLVIGLYMVVIIVIGAIAYAKVKNMTDFFMGGRRFGKVFMMFFAFGAGTSSEQAVSVVAGTWRAGLPGIWWQFLWLWATPFYWIIAPAMRRMRALTSSDFFEARYDTSTATLYSVFGITMAIVFMAGGLYGGGKMMNALTGGELDQVAERIDWEVPTVTRNADGGGVAVDWRNVTGYEIAILAMTVLFVGYGMAGGLGAAILTDFIQGVLTITFSFLLLPWILWEVGGFAGLHQYGEIKPGMFDLFMGPEAAAKVARTLGAEQITLFHILMLSVTALAGIVVQPHIMGVCGAGKTEFEGRFGFTFGNFIKRFCTIAWTFTGLACIVWYLGPELSPLSEIERQALVPDDAPAAIAQVDPAAGAKVPFDAEKDRNFADELFGRAAYDVLPRVAPGLVGLLLASLLAAIMSTSDAQMIVSSGLFTENIYKRFWAPDRTERHYLMVGRIAGLVIVLLALVLQTTFTDVIHALKVIIRTPAAIGISLWIGIIWRGWTPLAVWVSSIAAYVTWAVVAYYPGTLTQFDALSFMVKPESEPVEIADAWINFCYLSVGFTAGLITCFLSPRTPKEKLDRFFLLLRTPIRPGEHVSAPCTLPEDPLPAVPKLIDHPDIEIPRPTWVGVGGFVAAWACVGLIVGLTYWLSRLG